MLNTSNPFPGIRSFEPDEYELFFGREKQIGELIEILFTKRFVAVQGSSGCGKSSLIKAGLIPTLFKLEAEESESSWNQIYFRPGDSPINNLANSLFDIEEDEGIANIHRSPKQLAELLRADEASLLNIIKQQNASKNINRLIYIDQFEEIFRYKHLETESFTFSEANHFIRLLLHVVHKCELPIYIVISLRSDFLGECTEFPGLAETINIGSYLVPRLTRDASRLVITGPIEHNEGAISESLVDKLLDDVGDSPEQLLILQHALMRTWDYWIDNKAEDAPIDISHYEAIGTIHEALSFHGEQIYNELHDAKEKQIAEKVFKALVNIGAENKGTRRPTHLEEICVLANSNEDEVIVIIDKFRERKNAFLMPPITVSLENDSIIDISHESIMKIWVRGKNWVEEETKSAELYSRLSKSAELYQMGKTGLLTNPDLDLTIKWREQNKPNQTWALRYDPAFDRAVSFLEYSKKEYDLAISRKESQQKRKLKLARTFSILLGSAAIISILFLVVALNLQFKAVSSEKRALEKERISMISSKRAEEKRKEAIAHKKIAEQQQIIAEQQKLIADEQKKYAIVQQEISTQKKIEADNANDEAQKRRKEAEVARIVAEKEKNKSIKMRKVAEEQKEISERLSILAVSKSMAIKSIAMAQSGQADDQLASILALQSYIFNKTNKGYENDQDIFNALQHASDDKKILLGHKAKIRALQLIDKETFASCSDDRTIRVWNFTETEASRKFKTNKDIRCFVFSKENKSILAGCYNGQVLHWNLNEENPSAKSIFKSDAPITALVINSNGLLAFANSKGSVKLWDYFGNRNDTTTISGNSKVNTMQFSEQGKKLAIGYQNGEIKIVKIDEGNKIIQLNKEGAAITALTFNKTGTMLASSNSKKLVMIWNIEKKTATPANIFHSSKINALKFSPTESLLASCSYDGTVKLWNYNYAKEEPIVIQGHNDWVFDIEFSADGEKIISAGNDKTIRIWTINMGSLANSIQITRNLTEEEWVKYVGQHIDYQKTNPDL